MNRHLIIGNGVAGTMAAENIRKGDKEGSITIITNEGAPFYYRLRLNEYIAGEITEQALLARKPQWYKDMNIDLSLGSRVTGVDPVKKFVETEKGEKFNYDRLLLAMGSYSFVPPVKGAEKAGVFTIRNIEDAKKIIAYVKDIKNVVLIGGGLLGLEAGNALRKVGKDVSVVEFFPRLLPRQLDVKGAGRLQAIMEGLGFKFRLGAKTQAIEGEPAVRAVSLEGGEALPAGMVIVSAGVRPDMGLAKAMGVECDKGVKVNEHMMTSMANVYAAGDVAEFRGVPYGIWPAAMEQGKIAGANMAGGDVVYNGTTMANTLKVVGIDLASAGEIDADEKLESRVSASDTTYKKVVFDGNRMIGCIMLGDTTGFNKVTKAIADNKDISEIKGRLLTEGFDLNTI